MNEMDKKIIEPLLESCSKTVDPKKSFREQVEFLTSTLKQFVAVMGRDIDFDDQEVKQMIKESVVIEEDHPIVFAKGYTPWLSDVKPNINWSYYSRYERYLVKTKKWNWGTIQSINESTDTVLDHLQNPETDKFFAIKGLVMGDIQSGKTANYTALINKALDVKYKLIIVLAGLTKDLRSQTQSRLDKEVLGYQTKPDGRKGNSIGVGLVSKEEVYVNAITNSGDSGDLNKKTAETITTVLSNGMQPLIAVLKKNSSVLKALITTVLSSDVGAKTNGKFDVPVLIIDDEVDQASVNTKDSTSLNEASTINKLIRTMLQKFNRYAYVGYTATPFANVFINPYGFNDEEKDIFPEDFIICLPRPQKYCGVQEFFGIETIRDDNPEDDALTLDLFEPIDDYYDLFDETIKKTQKIKVDTPVVNINKSMENAFMHFIIASAVKYARGIIGHNSMLIHVARFKNPATSLRELVKNKISNMLKEYKYGDDSDRQKYKDYWIKKIKPVSKNRLMSDFSDSWDKISAHIITVFEMTLNGIKIVNGDSADVCDYESSNVGQHIIIGGDKLSRGLTLEGLIVSYYYRNSRTYDTLLQMGRWFGYRDGWIDLCRVFTSTEMVNSFINAGIATEMFKSDVEDMNTLKLTPAEFGLKIKYSPRLAPTSSSKMRTATKQRISFSESLQQLLSFRKRYVENNRKTTEAFLKKLSKGEKRESGNIVFKDIDSTVILDYLDNYKECDELVGSVSIKNWSSYIKKLNNKNELIKWTVVLHSNSVHDELYVDELGGYTIYKSQNTDRNLYANDEMEDLFLKAVTSPSDFKEFFNPDSIEYKIVKEYRAGDETISRKFTHEYGVLAIYVIDVYKKVYDCEKLLPNGKKRKIYKKGALLKGGKGVVGLGAWFPKTENFEDSAVEFYVNPVFINSNSMEDDENG